jgi:stage V sporulation protein B
MNGKLTGLHSMPSDKRSTILQGTIILTLAGFVTRLIGFFYKIFLSNTMGAELLGIYQLIFPIYGICFTIYATGIQTAISKLVASEHGKQHPENAGRILKIGLCLSVVLALSLSAFVYTSADVIACRFLLEARSASSLRILSCVFPFCGITSCINGYYYGLKKAGIPASTQLLEQIVRVLLVYLFTLYAGKGNMTVTCELAVFGIVVGEIASCFYNMISLFLIKAPANRNSSSFDSNIKTSGRRKIMGNLFRLSVPLSTNRLLLNVLHSIETVLIPTMLKRFGLSTAEALSAYGILNGMSIPFILFPTALINALAVLLLPTISEAQAVENTERIEKTTAVSIKYSLIIGIISTGIFVVFGRDLGNAVFHNEKAGFYLMVLAWLCPFIYLTTTLGSIINGLGKTHITFINSVVGALCKILLVVFLIPMKGIHGYLIALLIGQLIVTFFDYFAVVKCIHFQFDVENFILKPGIIVAIAGLLLKHCYDYFIKIVQLRESVLILIFCFLLGVISTGLLVITHAVSKEDYR